VKIPVIFVKYTVILILLVKGYDGIKLSVLLLISITECYHLILLSLHFTESVLLLRILHSLVKCCR